MPQHWKARSKAELFLGIDHSAISVSDSMRSIDFYETLGLRVASHSVNSGSQQARLDDLIEPFVEVTALAAAQATPHVELLCYRSDGSARKLELKSNDVATTRLVFDALRSPDAKAASPQSLIDPDGHHLVLVPSVEKNNSRNGKADVLGGSSPVIANLESAG
jgi:catechol 2,3-dioxygenase-like lactoylglutathione lyase family enzyme